MGRGDHHLDDAMSRSGEALGKGSRKFGSPEAGPGETAWLAGSGSQKAQVGPGQLSQGQSGTRPSQGLAGLIPGSLQRIRLVAGWTKHPSGGGSIPGRGQQPDEAGRPYVLQSLSLRASLRSFGTVTGSVPDTDFGQIVQLARARAAPVSSGGRGQDQGDPTVCGHGFRCFDPGPDLGPRQDFSDRASRSNSQGHSLDLRCRRRLLLVGAADVWRFGSEVWTLPQDRIMARVSEPTATSPSSPIVRKDHPGGRPPGAGGVFRAGQEVIGSHGLQRPRARAASILARTRRCASGTPEHRRHPGSCRLLQVGGSWEWSGALLVVDAFGGPQPTRVKKALQTGLVPILVVNKIDRPCPAAGRSERGPGLFIDLDAEDHQIRFPVVCVGPPAGGFPVAGRPSRTSAYAGPSSSTSRAPVTEAPLQLLVSNLDYDEYVGRLAIGRVVAARSPGSRCVSARRGALPKGASVRSWVSSDWTANRWSQPPSETLALTGLAEVGLGETVTDVDSPVLLPGWRWRSRPGQPSWPPTAPWPVRTAATSPRHLRDRLFREAERRRPARAGDRFAGCLRSLWARRAASVHPAGDHAPGGYELSVSAPRADPDGGRVLHEPIEI